MRPCRFDLQSTVVSSKYLIDFCDEFQFSPRYWRIKVRILMIKRSEGRSIHYRMAQRRIGKTATIVLLALLVLIGFSKAADQDGNCIQAVAIGTETDMYKEALTASLIKELQQSSDSYYDGSYSVFPTVELDTTELEQIYRQEGKTILAFKIMPFIGPHNTVGIDHLTLSLDSRGNITLLDYQHSEDF